MDKRNVAAALLVFCLCVAGMIQKHYTMEHNQRGSGGEAAV